MYVRIGIKDRILIVLVIYYPVLDDLDQIRKIVGGLNYVPFVHTFRIGLYTVV